MTRVDNSNFIDVYVDIVCMEGVDLSLKALLLATNIGFVNLLITCKTVKTSVSRGTKIRSVA